MRDARCDRHAKQIFFPDWADRHDEAAMRKPIVLDGQAVCLLKGFSISMGLRNKRFWHSRKPGQCFMEGCLHRQNGMLTAYSNER